ncbi:MAG: hypothetical protein CVU39_02760 [Chloroflexi bacterium HGW-Chloroflexi-10]|nr:MAG: hypothetical protein CVU39_02760 [Chloroflexi bacterium HGW-Chloroflexi-10]
MVKVIIYIEDNCEKCLQAIAVLEKLQKELKFEVQVININETIAIKNVYEGKTPFIKVGPYKISNDMSEAKLRMTIGAAIDRDRQLTDVGDELYQRRRENATIFNNSDHFMLWLSKNHIWLINFMLLLYVGLPFLAPVLAKYELNLPAKVIYTIYRPLCHQLAFRSWFLFGEQLYYPRSLAEISGVISYEQLTGENEINIKAAQQFIGNEVVGYKVALCQRDVALWGSMLLFGLIFVLSGKRIRSLHWVVWVLIGLIPIGIDGFSQLPGLASALPAWLPIRESNPLLRTITGALMGFTTSWFLFPLLEESMRETRLVLIEKLSALNKRTSS